VFSIFSTFVGGADKSRIICSLSHFPAVALLGPRHAGKTTLAKKLRLQREWIYLDLER
jgi:hypothetical protein